MAAVTLQLKRRPRAGTVGINLAWITQVMQQSPEAAKEALWNEFRPFVDGVKPTTHDKEWLETIVNWVPEGTPLKFTEMAPWLKLAARVARLDDQKEGQFTLSTGQAELIFNRLKDDRFTLKAMTPAFAEFCLEFMAAYGRKPDVLSDDLMYDDGEGEGDAE